MEPQAIPTILHASLIFLLFILSLISLGIHASIRTYFDRNTGQSISWYYDEDDIRRSHSVAIVPEHLQMGANLVLIIAAALVLAAVVAAILYGASRWWSEVC